MVADDTIHCTLAAELSNHAAIVCHARSMLKAANANTANRAEQALAEAGYRSENNSRP